MKQLSDFISENPIIAVIIAITISDIIGIIATMIVDIFRILF